jgi:hypothetical protein
MSIGGIMMMIGELAKKVVSTGIPAAVATILMLALMPSGAAAGACSLKIGKCGCTISSSGNYTLIPNPLDELGSLRSKGGTCIDIVASNVTLTGGYYLIGPVYSTYGATTSSSIGIHIEPSANKVMLLDLLIEGFGRGLLIDGTNVTTQGIYTDDNNKGTVVNGANAFLIEEIARTNDLIGIEINATATNFVMIASAAYGTQRGLGIELSGVSGAYLADISAMENKTFGIWLNGASDNVISGFDSEANGVAGVYLGCNAAGPNGTPCPAGVSSSNYNSLMGAFDKLAPSDGLTPESLVSSTGLTGIQQSYGVAVGLGNLHNQFLDINGDANLVGDALDENPGCGNNRWLQNTFTTSSPPPNTTFTCLN